jgi:hypothetical protein
LLDLSLRRYFSALADANAANVALQRAAATGALVELESDLLAYRTALASISAGLQADPFASLTTTVAAALQLRDQIVASGFPANEAFVFSQL